MSAPVRTGSRFQPLPGTLPATTGASGSGSARALPAGLTLVAAAGTPVHAVESGVVSLAGTHTEAALRVLGEGGHTIHYGGLAHGSVAVSDRSRVEAGTILGTVAAPRLSATGPAAQPHLHLRIVDGAGIDVDVAEFLIGLPDPNELGHAAVGAGMDVDPDALDQEIVGVSTGVVPGWGSAR
jgi:murein DD-endopeptidase MepM/ murein hydrolase activator NlpD